MTHDDMEQWATRITKVVIAEVRKCRKELGMTAQDLADACEELGYPIPRSVIANWESGRRLTITVPELLVLAKAVDTPPAALVFPLGTGTRVENLPFESTTPWAAFSWFTGDDPDHPHGGSAMHRTYARTERRIRTKHHDAWQLQFLPGQKAWPSESGAKFDLLVQDAHSELLPIRHRMREEGLIPPPLPDHIAFLDKEGSPADDTKKGSP